MDSMPTHDDHCFAGSIPTGVGEPFDPCGRIVEDSAGLGSIPTGVGEPISEMAGKSSNSLLRSIPTGVGEPNSSQRY